VNETVDPEDPLVMKLFDVEARVTAWNDQFGADALRKERITRKISNTMRDLIAKTRSAARNGDCREPLIGFRSDVKKEVVKEEQVLRKIDDIRKTYQSIADEYISGCPEYGKIINLSTVLQKRMKKSYDRAVRKEALKILAENKASEMLEKEQAKELKELRLQNKLEAQSQRESKKKNKEEAQAEREKKAQNKQKRKDLMAEKEIKKQQRG